MHDRSTHLTLPEAWDEFQVFLTGPVVAAGAVPGLLFCVPGLIFFGAPVVITLVLVAILLALVTILLLLVAAPFLIVRAILSRARRRRTSRQSTSMATPPRVAVVAALAPDRLGVQPPRPQPERRPIARRPR